MGRNDAACRRMPGDKHGHNLCIPDQVEDKLYTGKAVVEVQANFSIAARSTAFVPRVVCPRFFDITAAAPSPLRRSVLRFCAGKKRLHPCLSTVS